ncbi:class II aldolase/adducin N-terminal [Fomitopsis serialis]|uniref:class II aldolase/adducin N-terminal n=1 Tax=Fomitopsis serialis TaxID=139415 RepID=UPI002007EB73|nr:class II aldolase/adducin N-terminal [Neoantrodia serialis]KAH9934192.1 class II aldolase/adducin N-terminal [Neoantrodia serialis]
MSPPASAVETQTQTIPESIAIQLKGTRSGDPKHVSRNVVPKTTADPDQQSPREAICHGDIALARPPTFNSIHEERAYLTAHLAAAFRYWARAGFTEGLAGHISVRDPELPGAIWMNPSASDMVLVDMETGKVVGGNRKRPINEAGFFIHRAVHQARPDVHAACHCHTTAARAFSTFQRPLRMLTQDMCTLYDAQAVYANYGGIVMADDEGRRIAAALGETTKGAILMNHGLLTVGKTVDEACYLFGLMERSCDIELKVMVGEARGEKVAEISPEEAAYNFKTSSDPEVLYWDFQPEYDFEYETCNGKFDDFKGL